MLRLAALSLLIATAGHAHATPAYWQTFLETYKASGKLKEASCSVCHTEVPKHNAYGSAVNRAIEGGMALTGAVLKGVEGADADGDGFSNGDEIRANVLPGDRASKPAGVAKTRATESVAPVAPVASSVLPKHAFHPSIVHFPIALFLFGGVLDLVGMLRRRSEVRRAGLWNMTAGAIATALTIPTGFFAAAWSGYRLEWGSAVVTHLLFALGSAGLMTGLVVWRARREVTGPLYVAVVLVTLLLTGWASRLGGGLVYGD